MPTMQSNPRNRAGRNWQARFSLNSRGVHRQFLAGIALVSVIPLLTVWCILQPGFLTAPLPVSLLLAAAVLGGFLVLRRHPDYLVRVRRTLEHVMKREVPDAALPQVTDANEMAAIDHCLSAIVDELQQRVASAELEKERLQCQLAVARKVDSLRTMSIGVAHDLNNLLAAILGNTGIILRTLPAEATAKKNALEVEASALQAVELANKILIYSGKSSLSSKPGDLSAIAGSMQASLRLSVAKGIEVRYELAPNLPPIPADPALMRMVISGLVLNAAESYPGRHGTVHVRTSVTDCDNQYLGRAIIGANLSEGRYICLEVADHGCGMTGDIQSRMFDPFFTTKIRAHGLGLSAVMGAAHVHCGGIMVDSEEGKGTTVRVLFPETPCHNQSA